MSKMLASVNCLAEALTALAAGVDIIDLKQPAAGALGALAVADIREIVTHIAGRCPISATIGDLSLQPEIVYPAVAEVATTGVDYIKIGFFPAGNPLAVLESLRPLCDQGQALIAVMFADAQPDFALLPSLKHAGFTGVMLDTQHKQTGSLVQLLSPATLSEFVTQAHSLNLISGLAGSLRLHDIPELNKLGADYLGFRGALCQQQHRVNALDPDAVNAVLRAVQA